MNYQFRPSILRSFVRVVRDSLEKSMSVGPRVVTEGSYEKTPAVVSPERRRSTICDESSLAMYKLTLPTFRPEKRRSFIDAYQQGILKKSESRKKKQQQDITFVPEELHKLQVRKRLVKRHLFRVQGLAPSTIKQSTPKLCITQNKSLSLHKIQALSNTCKYTPAYSPSPKRPNRNKRVVREEMFSIDPWQGTPPNQSPSWDS